jgi:hypothetical protein
MRIFPFLLLCGSVLLCATVGCGEKNPLMTPAGGTVLLDGKPLEGATVNFMGEGAARAASGVTDASGKFSLTTFEPNDGAAPGKHIVTISKIPAVASAPPSGGNVSSREVVESAQSYAKAGEMPEIKNEIPDKYSQPLNSGLSAEVKEGQPNNFTFELSSSGS